MIRRSVLAEINPGLQVPRQDVHLQRVELPLRDAEHVPVHGAADLDAADVPLEGVPHCVAGGEDAVLNRRAGSTTDNESISPQKKQGIASWLPASRLIITSRGTREDDICKSGRRNERGSEIAREGEREREIH